MNLGFHISAKARVDHQGMVSFSITKETRQKKEMGFLEIDTENHCPWRGYIDQPLYVSNLLANLQYNGGSQLIITIFIFQLKRPHVITEVLGWLSVERHACMQGA